MFILPVLFVRHERELASCHRDAFGEAPSIARDVGQDSKLGSIFDGVSTNLFATTKIILGAACRQAGLGRRDLLVLLNLDETRERKACMCDYSPELAFWSLWPFRRATNLDSIAVYVLFLFQTALSADLVCLEQSLKVVVVKRHRRSIEE